MMNQLENGLRLIESQTIYLKRDGDVYNVFTYGVDGVSGIVKYIHQLQNFVYDNLKIELR